MAEFLEYPDVLQEVRGAMVIDYEIFNVFIIAHLMYVIAFIRIQ